MEKTLFSACQFTRHRLNWRSAIQLACRPLEQQKKITTEYVQAIIHATEQDGPWYILSPMFALPHARPENGVLSKNSVLSLLCCREYVEFPGHPDIRLIVVLAAANSEQHIQTIQRLVCWLDEGDRLQRFTTVKNKTQFAELIASQL
ncbi:PTS sugar transporter subunit IIA [Klebsiella indica]|uniref:Ascorbate-specific PTS system EIIA component n=1 Tax=Klebsiella indica TaxID=2582917 RepID=A0A5R9LJC3_9ENTR|nr:MULTISPECIES: PTS sugar transporter subunit IIA [Klebsiella]TLV19896.1 PTS sugar transporter subunit IIA [Klebsiella indica]